MTTDTLTELEGAVLSLLDGQEGLTAYAVRSAFERSPSEFWSGSAGAIYPALKRLEGRKLISGQDQATGRRKGRAYRLTADGAEALEAWAGNVSVAAGAGFDPFRVRAKVWAKLPAADRADLYRALAKAISERIAALSEEAGGLNHPAQIERRQQASRLDWLDDQS